jgi:hypothetical protein
MNQILPNGTYVEFDVQDFIDGDIMRQDTREDDLADVVSPS